jgi:hypothetical protein
MAIAVRDSQRLKRAIFATSAEQAELRELRVALGAVNGVTLSSEPKRTLSSDRPNLTALGTQVV